MTRAAEGMATVAALTGQLFLAVMLGRVVGGYVSQDSDASTQ